MEIFMSNIEFDRIDQVCLCFRTIQNNISVVNSTNMYDTKRYGKERNILLTTTFAK